MQCPSGENCPLPMMTHFENNKIEQWASRERNIFCNGSVHRLSARIHDLSSYKNGVGGIIEAQQYLTPTSLHPGISLYVCLLKDDGRYFSVSFPISSLESIVETLQDVKRKYMVTDLN